MENKSQSCIIQSCPFFFCFGHVGHLKYDAELVIVSRIAYFLFLKSKLYPKWDMRGSSIFSLLFAVRNVVKLDSRSELTKSSAQHFRARRYLYICAFFMVNIHVILLCRGVVRQRSRITFNRFLPSASKPGSDLPTSLKLICILKIVFWQSVFSIWTIHTRHLDVKVTSFAQRCTRL